MRPGPETLTDHLPQTASLSLPPNNAESADMNIVTCFGTISLNNSIFMRPAGVSPILTSMKTIGRVGLVVLEDMSCNVLEVM